MESCQPGVKMGLLEKSVSYLLAISCYVYSKKASLASKKADKVTLVAHTGFEPVISSLRGRCPKPLDECAFFCPIEYITLKKLRETLAAWRPQPS